MRFLALLALLFWGVRTVGAAVPLLPVAASWRYLVTTGSPSPQEPGAWLELDFDDTDWRTGVAPLGRGFEGLAAPLPASPGALLARTTLVVNNPADFDGLQFSGRAADGLVVWLNGVEVVREGVAEGVEGPEGLAAQARSVPVPFTRGRPLAELPGLQAGSNVLAVLVLPAAASRGWFFELGVDADLDLTAPVATIIDPAPGSVLARLPSVEVQFSEGVRGVDAADLRFNGVPAAAVEEVGLGQFVFTVPDLTQSAVAVTWAADAGITDRSLPGNRFEGVGWSYTVDELAVPAGVILSEFMADNDRTLRDEDGDYSDWIELANLGVEDVSLAGWALTDDAAVPAKWVFPDLTLPARGYLVVFASSKDRRTTGGKLHTNFKLDPDGEYLGLRRADGQVVSEFGSKFPKQKKDVAYGRVSGAPAVEGFFSKPTPRAANAVGGDGFSSEVKFSQPSRTYTSPIPLVLSTADTNAVIRYTVDRTLPASNSPVYTAPLTLNTAVHVRARAFTPGKLPGPVASETYMPLSASGQAVKSDLPILLIHDYGRGRPTTSPGVFATLQVFEPVDGVTRLTNPPTLSHRALVGSRGSSTEGLAKVSLKVEFQDEFGLDRDVAWLGFPSESDFVLYAPNSFDPIMTHNPFMHRLFRDLGWYSSRTRFVEVYLVGSGVGPITSSTYQGIYVLEEKIKQGKNRVDVDKLQPEHVRAPEVTGGYLFKVDRPDPGDSGFSAAGVTMMYLDPKEPLIEKADRLPQRQYLTQFFGDFQRALNGAGYRDPVNGYAKFLNVPQSIDYHILTTLSFNVDAMVLSTYLHKPREGKLSFGPLWDFDRALGSTDGRDSAPRTWGNNFFTAYWWPRLFSDPDFLQRWIDRYQELRRGNLSQANLFGLMDQMTGELKQAQPREKAKWGTTYRGGSYPSEIAYSKAWLSNRLSFMDAQFAALPLPGPTRLTPAPGRAELSLLMPSTVTNATIYYTTNGTDPRLPGGAVSGASKIYPVGQSVAFAHNARVIARVFHPGQRAASGGGPSLVSKWSGPVGVPVVAAPSRLQLTEIHYHPAEAGAGGVSSSDLEFLEFHNAGSSTLVLDGYRLAGGVTFAFGGTNELRELGPGARCVVVSDRAAFSARYPEVRAMAGQYDGKLNNAGDRVELLGPVGESVAVGNYLTTTEPLADGAGWSLVPVSEAESPAVPGSAGGWRLSAAVGGSPGSADLASRPGFEGDRDLDGLPDVWEVRMELRPDRAEGDDGATGDPDRDGVSNRAEFLAGTDPKSAASRAVLVAERRVGGVIRLRVPRVPGRKCRVVAGGGLSGVELETWEFPAQAVPGVTDLEVVPGEAARFFRLVFP